MEAVKKKRGCLCHSGEAGTSRIVGRTIRPREQIVPDNYRGVSAQISVPVIDSQGGVYRATKKGLRWGGGISVAVIDSE